MNRQVRESGIEAGFRQSAQLELSVAVGKKRKHVKRQPVRRRLVERSKNARIIRVTGSPREQRLRFFAPITPKIAVQQVHHRPQMPPFFDVHLKNIPQVVHRRTRRAQQSLLFDRSRLRIALRYNHAPQR